MKEFDINLAKQGKPVCTRDGRKARIICFDAKDERPIIGLVCNVADNGEECELIETFHKSGKHYEEVENGFTDLMMLNEKHEGWQNVYRSIGGKYISQKIYDTKEEALSEKHPSRCERVDTIKIEWSE